MRPVRSGILPVALAIMLASHPVPADDIQTPHARPGVRKENESPVQKSRRLILAHYMPWYVARPDENVWGWHWTMNHFDPSQVIDGKRPIASHFYPVIGPYDSGDPHVLEYHLLLMKLAGIDGVIVDWYGREKFNDYATLHRNTARLVESTEKYGLKLAVCYEDQTIPRLVEGGRIRASDRVAHAVAEIDWLAANWFRLKNYVRLEGKPVLLSFGQNGLTDREWTQCLGRIGSPVTYFSEHSRRTAAAGAFDWPVPGQGVPAASRFLKLSRSWPHAIPVAFPRFRDVYRQAGVHDGFGRINDDCGSTFRRTLELALSAEAQLIQIATWNDWGEGTVVEPGREYGFRDLEVLQAMRRRHIDRNFRPTAADLKLPGQLLNRRRAAKTEAQTIQLDEVGRRIATGDLAGARRRLAD